jgi:hypothetical protein
MKPEPRSDARGILPYVLAAAIVAPASIARLPAAVADPGSFPACPDPDSIAIVYQTPFMESGTELRPDSLLYGRTTFWAIARPAADCEEGKHRPRVELFLDEIPTASEDPPNRFITDVGTNLRGTLVRLVVTLAGSTSEPTRTVERTVKTLDASVAPSDRRTFGASFQETETVWMGPPDRLTLTVVAKDESGDYVRDLRSGELAVFLKSERLPQSAILDFEGPEARKPVRILLALDVSAYIKPGRKGSTFHPRYRSFVEDLVLGGLEDVAASLEGNPAMPPVELGIVRYARSSEWLAQSFWRLDRGVTAEQLHTLREFLLKPAPEGWALGKGDAEAALQSMKMLWHYFDGRRGVVLAPTGREVSIGRADRIFSPSSLVDPETHKERLETVKSSLERGDEGADRHVFEHTERRFPMVFALLPAFPAERDRLGYDALQKTVRESGGMVIAWSGGLKKQDFVDCLRTAVEDLSHGYLATFEIPNDSQTPKWKRLSLESSRPHVLLRAPTFYRSSGDLCHYLPSYLVTQDPVARLVAADRGSTCWRDRDVAAMIQTRLFGRPAELETSPAVKRELFRSFVELRFRQLQSARTKRQAKKAYRDLVTLSSMAGAYDPALLESYRAIADRVRAGSNPPISPPEP